MTSVTNPEHENVHETTKLNLQFLIIVNLELLLAPSGGIGNVELRKRRYNLRMFKLPETQIKFIVNFE